MDTPSSRSSWLRLALARSRGGLLSRTGLDPRRHMRVDLAPEVAGAPALAGVSLEIAGDGNWSDDGAEMEKHLVIKTIAG